MHKKANYPQAVDKEQGQNKYRFSKRSKCIRRETRDICKPVTTRPPKFITNGYKCTTASLEKSKAGCLAASAGLVLVHGLTGSDS